MNQELSTWDARLSEQVKRKYENYRPHRIKLDDARDNTEYPGMSGDNLIVIDASSAAALATVRLNSTSNDPIVLKAGRRIQTIFTKLYFSCTAQTGEWLDIIVGIDFDIEIEDVGPGITQPAIVVTNANADADTQAAAHACKSVLIRALSTNTGLVWVNFGAAAVEASCHDLAAGEVLPAPLDNTNKIHALFKVANEIISVIYRN